MARSIIVAKSPLTMQVHLGNPKMARIPELVIKALPECEGGGWYMPADQAQAIMEAWNSLLAGRQTDPTEEMVQAAFLAMEEYEGWIAERKSPRPNLPTHIFRKMMAAA